MDFAITINVKMINDTHGNIEVLPNPKMTNEEAAFYLEWVADTLRRGTKLTRVK
jgi:hypothetical protein